MIPILLIRLHEYLQVPHPLPLNLQIIIIGMCINWLQLNGLV